jgi:hypothetical protein
LKDEHGARKRPDQPGACTIRKRSEKYLLENLPFCPIDFDDIQSKHSEYWGKHNEENVLRNDPFCSSQCCLTTK